MNQNADPLAGGQRLVLPAEERGEALITWADGAQWRHYSDWYAALEASDTRELIAAIGGLTENPKNTAFRDAARAMVEQKLTGSNDRADGTAGAANREAREGIESTGKSGDLGRCDSGIRGTAGDGLGLIRP